MLRVGGPTKNKSDAQNVSGDGLPLEPANQRGRASVKYVYFFGAGKAEGDGAMKDVLGGKGAGLAEMTRIGLPVPAGFTISTECCDYYLKREHKFPASLRAEVKKNLAH